MKIRFSNDVWTTDDASIILCPNCGYDCIHQGKIEIFDRNEDEKKGLHVVVENKEANISTNLDGNPSSRRQGLKIHFECETCDAKPILCIEQHKGNTFIYFKKY